MAYISCKNLCFSYDEGQVINNLTLDIDKGESIGIVGANGAGKSTLMQIIMGLNTGFSGSVSVDGISLSAKNFNKIRRKVGYIFQDFDTQLFMPTAYEDVCFGLKGKEAAKADDIFKRLNIERLKSKYTHKMSGGEKKLVAIASVLVMKPECILFDEPTVGLDPKNRENIINIIRSLDITKVIATHDLDMALEVCDRIIVMKDGTISAGGLPEDILLDENIMKENDLALPIGFKNWKKYKV